MPAQQETYNLGEFGVGYDKNKSVLLIGSAGFLGDLDPYGTTYADGLPATGTTSGTATAGSSTTLTMSGGAFKTTDNGLKHLFIYITGGTGKGQARRITDNTATIITVGTAWDTTPDSTSTFEIGAIKFLWESSAIEGEVGRYVAARKVRIACESTEASPESFDLKIYISGLSDHEISSTASGTTEIGVTAWGNTFHWLPYGGRTRRFKAEISGILSGERFTLDGVVIDFLEFPR